MLCCDCWSAERWRKAENEEEKQIEVRLWRKTEIEAQEGRSYGQWSFKATKSLRKKRVKTVG